MFLLLFRTFFLFNEGPIRTFLLFVEEFIHAKQFYQCEGFIAAASATSAVIATFHVLIGHGSVVGAASASRSCCMIFLIIHVVVVVIGRRGTIAAAAAAAAAIAAVH